MNAGRVAAAIGAGLTGLTLLIGIGKTKSAKAAAKKPATTPATPATPEKPEAEPTGMVLNATTFLGERLAGVPTSEVQKNGIVKAFNNLGVKKDGTIRVQPPVWAKEQALNLADAFDRDGANPDLGAAVRDFTLAAMKLAPATPM